MVGAEQRSTDALLVAVRALANERLPGPLTLDDAASSLGISRRTLQRKITASGTTLSRVTDEVRRDRAEQLVGEGLLTMGEVAAKVGFAEQASFTRAWWRWFGAPPSRRRRGSPRNAPRAP
jgi:AraC-like DNA-binding protein